jgi:hypothetical protein
MMAQFLSHCSVFGDERRALLCKGAAAPRPAGFPGPQPELAIAVPRAIADWQAERVLPVPPTEGSGGEPSGPGVPKEASVWIFHGDGARFAAGVFENDEQGLRWAAEHRLSGTLTEYPVGDGCYDVAVRDGYFKPSRPHHGTKEHIAQFSPGWTRHIHIDDGSALR